MSITAHRMTGGDTGIKERLQTLAPSLAALLYPFALEGFNASVTRIAEGGAGALGLSWLGAAMCLALAFAVPLIAMLAAMSLSGIDRPTAAQLRAKRMALLAVAAPTLFTFLGVVLYMLHDPVPDTWLWVACWAIALALLLQSDNDAPARVAVRLVPVPLRVAHGVSALALVMIFLALHIANHLMFPAGAETYDAVMKVFRHVYRTDILQPLVVALFLFQIGTGLFFAWRLTAAPPTASAPSKSPRASISPFTCWATWIQSWFSHGRISASTPGGASQRARLPASSRTRGTSASCRIIGSACSLSLRISRPGRVWSSWRMASARRSPTDSWSAARLSPGSLRQ
jgi:hypothetical protein